MFHQLDEDGNGDVTEVTTDNTCCAVWCTAVKLVYLSRMSLCWGACRMKCWSGDWSPTTPTPCKHEL